MRRACLRRYGRHAFRFLNSVVYDYSDYVKRHILPARCSCVHQIQVVQCWAEHCWAEHCLTVLCSLYVNHVVERVLFMLAG